MRVVDRVIVDRGDRVRVGKIERKRDVEDWIVKSWLGLLGCYRCLVVLCKGGRREPCCDSIG